MGIDANQFGYLWVVTLNTADMKPNQQYFMRYHTNDGENSTNAEYPETKILSISKLTGVLLSNENLSIHTFNMPLFFL